MPRAGIDRDEDEDHGRRPRRRGRRPRRRGRNPAIVILIVLAAALPFLAGGAYVIYRVITRDEPQPAVNSSASSTRVPVVASNPLEKYRKRFIGQWETYVARDGVTRHIIIEFRSDGTQVAWGSADGRRAETSGRWEALKVENGQLLVRTVVNGITRETFYSFPSENEYRYTMPDGREVIARRPKAVEGTR